MESNKPEKLLWVRYELGSNHQDFIPIFREPTPSELIVEATRLIGIRTEKLPCLNQQIPTPKN